MTRLRETSVEVNVVGLYNVTSIVVGRSEMLVWVFVTFLIFSTRLVSSEVSVTETVDIMVCVFLISLVDVIIDVNVVDRVVEIGSFNVEMDVSTSDTVVVFRFGLTVIELVNVVVRRIFCLLVLVNVEVT